MCVTADNAERLADYFGGDATSWVALQADCDLKTLSTRKKLNSGFIADAKWLTLDGKPQKTKKPANFRLRAFVFCGSPTWTRTRDLRINRHFSDSLRRKLTHIFTVVQTVLAVGNLLLNRALINEPVVSIGFSFVRHSQVEPPASLQVLYRHGK